MGWETSLPWHWSHDNSRRSMSNCPGHNRLLHKGRVAGASMCKSADPTTLQVWSSKSFPQKGYLWGCWFWVSTIAKLAPKGPRTAIDIEGNKVFHCFGYHHLPWTMGWRVTGAHYQQLCQCCPSQINQRDPSIPNVGDDIKRTGSIWR